MSLFNKRLRRTRGRLSCSMPGMAVLQVLLDQVFDRPVDSGPSLYQLSSGQSVLYPGPHADVSVEVWWTFGQPVEDGAIVDEAEWFEFLSNQDELEHRRALYLTDVPFDPDLQGRFGVRPNVLAVRPGLASRVAITHADDPATALAVSRLLTAADLMA